MNILAIDTSMAAVSACVMADGADRSTTGETCPMQRGHAEALMPLIARVVGGLPGGFASLDRIAVTVGPGSFTGIRVGIAAARAISLARGIPVVGVSTLAALAAPCVGDAGGSTIAASVDAHHGNLYLAAYVAGGRNLLPPRLLSVRDAVRQLGSQPLKLAGSGAPLLAIEAWSAGVVAEIVGELVSPAIDYVARLGLLVTPGEAPATPLYLKAPDARPPDGGRIARTFSGQAG